MAYYTCNRCESFNSIIRGQNVFSNHLSPSRDIASRLSIIEEFRFLANGGKYSQERYVVCLLYM